jgi:hypothetical protein
MLYVAASERYLDIVKVVETPADEFLFFVNFLKRKNQLDEARIRRQFNS